MSLGFWEILLVLIVVLLVFGAGKLPNLMGELAKGIKSFKTNMKDTDEVPHGAPSKPGEPPRAVPGPRDGAGA